MKKSLQDFLISCLNYESPGWSRSYSAQLVRIQQVLEAEVSGVTADFGSALQDRRKLYRLELCT